MIAEGVKRQAAEAPWTRRLLHCLKLGVGHGHDLEAWLRVESELLHRSSSTSPRRAQVENLNKGSGLDRRDNLGAPGCACRHDSAICNLLQPCTLVVFVCS